MTQISNNVSLEANQRATHGAVGMLWWQGLRSSFLLRPHWQDLPSRPGAIAWLVLLAILLQALVDRLYIVGPATFYWRASLADWFETAVTIWICWLLVPRPREDNPREPSSAAALFGIFAAQALTFTAISGVVLVPIVRNAHFVATPTGQWVWRGTLLPLVGWYAVAQLRLVWQSGAHGVRLRVFASLLLIGTLALALEREPPRFWYATAPLSDEASRAVPFRLTQEALELQSQILQTKLQQIASPRPGVVNFYAITFAPYADEDVFGHEANLVATLMQERFGAAGRTIQLVNNRETIREWPWATPLNLKRSIQRMAQLMKRDRDILFLHLTSHGAKNGELVADFLPLQVDPVTPGMLRQWLDESGILYRVISVSACYSGSWIKPLSGPDTLVMTAADADHTSYGCGRGSELTYFGRAMFDEQLRHTWSFEKAHAAARTIIEQREREAGKGDGYSNPQIQVGAGIRGQLAVFEIEREKEMKVEAAGHARHAEPGRNADADHLVELLRYKDELEAAKQTCLNSDRTISTEAFQKANPDYFGDITSGDRRWPAALEAYGDYVKMLCEHPTIAESLALMSENYASLLSKDDLRASIAFYSSATGNRLVAGHREIAAALFKAHQDAQMQYAPRATVLLRERIQQISNGLGADREPANDGTWPALKGLVARSYGFYYLAEFLFAAGFLALGLRHRSAGLIVAGLAALVVLLAQVELSNVGAGLDDARKRGADLVPYKSARDAWKFASAAGYLAGALGVIYAAFRSWTHKEQMSDSSRL
jgi:hypothetical protein